MSGNDNENVSASSALSKGEGTGVEAKLRKWIEWTDYKVYMVPGQLID